MKNPFEKFSGRTIRIIFTAGTVFVFLVCFMYALSVLYFNALSNDQCAWRNIEGRDTALLITDVVPGGVTDKAGIKDGDILLKINGQSFIQALGEKGAMSIINAVPRGDSATYLIERNGTQFETRVEVLKVFLLQYLANFLFGLGFLFVGYVVVMTKPQGKTQRLFGYFGLLAMIYFGISFARLSASDPDWLFIPASALWILSMIFGPLIFIYFFQNFPIKREIKNLKLEVISIIAVNFIVVLLFIFSSNHPLLPLYFRPILASFPGGFFIAGLVIFTRSYFHLEPERRKPLKPILISSVVWIIAQIYTSYVFISNPYVIFLDPLTFLPSFLFFCIPLAFGYSIFKYRLMDFDRIIKKSIIYGTVTALLAALYMLLVFGAGSLLGGILGSKQNEAISIIALVIIAFVFDPIKGRVQSWVDKIFYRDKYDYQKALLEFSKTLPLQVELENIMNSVVSTISSTMHVDKVAVLLFDDNGGVKCLSKNIREELCNFCSEENGLFSLLKRTREPQSISHILDNTAAYELNEGDRALAVKSGIELAVPMMLQEQLIGTINTGPKLSFKAYSQEDVDLLSTVASQAAIAIENARLYKKEKALYHVHEELKLASRIQLEWLPKSSPQIAGFEIAGKTVPAEIVGGDYFDYIHINLNRLAVCLGDVSGKGLPAALLMANLQAILRSQSLASQSPKDCIRQTNNLLVERTRDDMFITLFYGVLEPKKNLFTYTNAGHNYPLHFTKNGEPQCLDKGGLLLSVQENRKYDEGRVKLQRGDLIVIYSDGITESFNRSGSQFGEERLTDTVKRHRDKKPSDIIEGVINEVNSFAGGEKQFDDMTLVVIKKL